MRLVVSLIALLLSAGCVTSECANEVVTEIAAPDNEHVATVFLRNCGATAPVVRVVSLRNARSDFDGDDTEAYVLTMQGEHSISVEWKASEQLVIRRPRIAEDIFTERSSWNDVQIATEP